jgi:hypothetical protein
LLSSITFAAPVSTPNPNLSDTPIISGGGNVSGGNTCRAYQTDGTAVSLSGGETLVFYASGGGVASCCDRRGNFIFSPASSGGYLSTKSNYSGTVYVRVKLSKNNCSTYWECPGNAIGLFARNTDNKNDFIAGAGAGGGGSHSCWGGEEGSGGCTTLYGDSGGGWFVYGKGSFVSVYNGCWFCTIHGFWVAPGFHGPTGSMIYANTLGAASSVSAYYNSYTKNYTSFGNSLTISAGGFHGQANPTLYVCQ